MEKAICPSARGKEGAQLIGIRQDDGSMAILPQPLPLDKTFFEKAREQPGNPEERFRFANKCVEGGCMQWTGHSCRIAEEIVTHLSEIKMDEPLPRCSIRPQCRWYRQSGPDACRVCPYVITQISELELSEYYENVAAQVT